jgi:Cu2+-exporting ATPase
LKNQNLEFIPPQDRVSPSSVYYCPMECEGDKVYFVQGKRCPVCNMYCVPIEEKKLKSKLKLKVIIKPQSSNLQRRKILLPMFCEGDKTYPENVGCPFVEWIW